jgi:hypothetical protein
MHSNQARYIMRTFVPLFIKRLLVVDRVGGDFRPHSGSSLRVSRAVVKKV